MPSSETDSTAAPPACGYSSTLRCPPPYSQACSDASSKDSPTTTRQRASESAIRARAALALAGLARMRCSTSTSSALDTGATSAHTQVEAGKRQRGQRGRDRVTSTCRGTGPARPRHGTTLAAPQGPRTRHPTGAHHHARYPSRQRPPGQALRPDQGRRGRDVHHPHAARPPALAADDHAQRRARRERRAVVLHVARRASDRGLRERRAGQRLLRRPRRRQLRLGLRPRPRRRGPREEAPAVEGRRPGLVRARRRRSPISPSRARADHARRLLGRDDQQGRAPVRDGQGGPGRHAGPARHRACARAAARTQAYARRVTRRPQRRFHSSELAIHRSARPARRRAS